MLNATTASVTKLASVEQRYWHFAHCYLTNGFNGTAAYKSVYGDHLTDNVASSSASRLLMNVEVRKILADLTKGAWDRSELDQDYVLSNWKSMADANVFDFLTIAADGPFAGQVTLKAAEELKKLPLLTQRNVKRLKYRTTIRELPNGNRISTQVIDIEIVDRASVLGSIAKWLGLFLNREAQSGEDLVQAIRDAEERALNRSVN